MGKTTVARAAVEELALRGRRVGILELPEDEGDCNRLLDEAPEGPRILTGGLGLHRVLAKRVAPEGAVLQRFPLSPLPRLDLESWARRSGARIGREELLLAFEASGGHPLLFAAWLHTRRSLPAPEAIEKELMTAQSDLFRRIDRELLAAELAAPFAWLEEHGLSSVDELRRATRADKQTVDRLVMAGPVSRTQGERSEIQISCGLYRRWRAEAR